MLLATPYVNILLAKIYKPTWTKTSLRLVFVLLWNNLSTDVPRIRRSDENAEKDGRRKIKYKSFVRNNDVVTKYIFFRPM